MHEMESDFERDMGVYFTKFLSHQKITIHVKW